MGAKKKQKFGIEMTVAGMGVMDKGIKKESGLGPQTLTGMELVAAGVDKWMEGIRDDPDEMAELMSGPSPEKSTDLNKRGEKIIIGKCPNDCGTFWNFYLGEHGEICRVPEHECSDGSICPGSGEKAVQIIFSYENEYNADSHVKALEELSQIAARERGETLAQNSSSSKTGPQGPCFYNYCSENHGRPLRLAKRGK